MMSANQQKKSYDELLHSLQSKGLVCATDEVPFLEMLKYSEKIENLQSTIIKRLQSQLKRSG